MTRVPRARRKTALAIGTASIIAVGAVGVPSASAYTVEIFMNNQGLSAGNANASSNAATSLIEVYGTSDHTWCASKARGYAGYTSSPNGGNNTTIKLSTCNPGYLDYRTDVGSTAYHGAAWNQNTSTFDNFSYASFKF